MKNMFVMWSGGLDSTFLIQELLHEGNNVTAGYFSIKNNHEQQARELKAIEAMLPFFDKFKPKFKYLGIVQETNVIQCTSNVILQQAIIWPSIVLSIDSTIDEVCIGYIMNDCALSYLSEIETIFKAYNGLLHKPLTVKFPLIKWDKKLIWDNLHLDLRKEVVWCEYAYSKDYKMCYSCVSCKRMVNAGIMPSEEKSSDKITYFDLKVDPSTETQQLSLPLELTQDYK